jgi:hypothetical protein
LRPTLPPEILETITNLPIGGTIVRPDDRRSHYRIEVSLQGVLWPGGDGPCNGLGSTVTGASGGVGSGVPVTVRDISGDGISLVGPVALAVAKKFILEFGRSGRSPIRLRFETVRTEPIAGNLFLVAASFEGVHVVAQAAAPKQRTFWSWMVRKPR